MSIDCPFPEVPPAAWKATPNVLKAMSVHLLETIRALEEAVQRRDELVSDLEARVKDLEGSMAKDSHNSSLPPSSDKGKRRKKRSLRRSSGRKPGGQPGHTGHTLRMVDEPDKVEHLVPERCEHCGESLSEAETIDIERRQVLDIPPGRLEATEYQAHRIRCPHCDGTTRAAFPDKVAQPVQYGERIRAEAIYLHCQQLLPFQRTTEVMSDMLGCNISEGSLQAAITECFETLGDTEEQIKQVLVQAPVIGVDETGMYVDGKREWLHVCRTSLLTHYAHHPKRGNEATDAIGILPLFRGTGEHDSWAAYAKYPWTHSLCNAHHGRELLFVWEQYEQSWAMSMWELLLEIKHAVEDARACGKDALDEEVKGEFYARYARVLDEGLSVNPAQERARHERRTLPEGQPARKGRRGRIKQTKTYNLLIRMQRKRDEVLRFMTDFRVPFDNNGAERDIRMMKLQQKTSGCFRTSMGATIFCRIRSYMSTARKQGYNILSAVHAALCGAPIPLTAQA